MKQTICPRLYIFIFNAFSSFSRGSQWQGVRVQCQPFSNKGVQLFSDNPPAVRDFFQFGRRRNDHIGAIARSQKRSGKFSAVALLRWLLGNFSPFSNCKAR
jgi:hypothetical protein